MKEYTGQINIRISKELHTAIAYEAHLKNISLNKLIEKKLNLTTTILPTNYIWKIDCVIERFNRCVVFLSKVDNKEITLNIKDITEIILRENFEKLIIFLNNYVNTMTIIENTICLSYNNNEFEFIE